MVDQKKSDFHDKKYLNISSNTESCFAKYGDNFQGVGWTRSQEDANARNKMMLNVIQPSHLQSKVTLLDFGCGLSHLYEYILSKKLTTIDYSGLDISQKFIELSRAKFPKNEYYHLDILENDKELPEFDYIIMNGPFTEKADLSFEEMWGYFQNNILKLFQKARVGIAFNTMSKHVDWERSDLFHVPFDLLADFLVKKVTRHFTIHHEYGLYEYTTYVYRGPQRFDL